MKRIFQILLLLLVMIYGFGDIATTANAFKLDLEEGNLVIKWIIANFDFNVFIAFKILATIVGCFSLAYCYEKDFPITAVASSIMVIIISIMVIINNIFAASGGGVFKIEPFLILPLQLILVILPIILLRAEATHKERLNL